MGKYSKFILIVSIFVSSFLSTSAFAEYDPKVEGCKHFCRARYPLDEGGRDTGFDNCIVQTQQEGKCGSSSKSTKVTNIPIPSPRPDTTATSAAAPTNQCQKDFERLKNACEGTADEADSTCDESNNTAMTNSANSAKSTGANTSADIQNACGNSNKVSSSAKKAMTQYKETCSGAISDCRTSCAELASFLSEGSCNAAIGFSQSSANAYSNAQTKRCDSHQSSVDAADKAISNYGDNSDASAVCQLGAMGAQSLAQAEQQNEQAAQQKTFCAANPNYPGCGSAQSANCNDPSQANNKVCICSKNPAACGSSQTELASVNPSLADPGSRLPSASSNLGMGDMPNVPVLDQPSKSKGSSDGVGIDGRQATSASVGGGSGGGSNSPVKSANAKGGDSPDYSSGGGYGGGGGSGGRFGASGGGSGGGYAGRPSGSDGSKNGNQGPDLRQFLPGGAYDPQHKAMAGKVGQDGITGPHTDNWKKIQNRFQVIKGTLEP
jgi:hypothetical protein